MQFKIKIKSVEKQFDGKNIEPISASLFVLECGSQFNLELYKDGKLFVENEHLIGIRSNGKWGYDRLLLKPQDLPELEQIITHWKEISDKFIQIISSGNWFQGHLSNKYVYPDGSEYECAAKDQNKPIISEGGSFDKHFSSNGCKYIDSHPYEQHYKHGRLEYFLRKNDLGIQDNKTIQILEDKQPKFILHLLKYVENDPEKAFLNIINNYGMY